MIDRAEKILQHITQSGPAELAARRDAGIPDEVGDRVRQLPMRQQLLKFLPAALAMLALSACVSNEYMGISLKPGVADSDIQELAHRAEAGDKQAQLQLGIAFEEGRGVVRNLTKARNLYRLAATDSGGPVWVYSPPVGNGTKGRIISIDVGPKQAGLATAKQRLSVIERKRIER